MAERLKSCSPDERRRKLGLTHRAWDRIKKLVEMDGDPDDDRKRRPYARLCILIPGHGKFKIRCPGLGAAYRAPGAAEVALRMSFHTAEDFQTAILQGMLDTMEVPRSGEFLVAVHADDVHVVGGWQVHHARIVDPECMAWCDGVSPTSYFFMCPTKDYR
eukprot:gene1944-5673_t